MVAETITAVRLKDSTYRAGQRFKVLKTMENLGRVMYEVELPLIPGERGIIFAHECVIVMNDYDTWKSTDPDDAAYCPHGHWHGEGCDECEPPVEPPAKQ